jgi:cold shock CspA family protein
MLLSWDFEYTNQTGKKSVTRTAQALLEEVAFPVAMHEIIDNRVRRNDPIINGLFTNRENSDTDILPAERRTTSRIDVANFKPSRKTSTVKAVKDQYGFINNEPEDAFFHSTSVVDSEFLELQVGDTVEFLETLNEKGQCVAKEVRMVEANGNV